MAISTERERQDRLHPNIDFSTWRYLQVLRSEVYEVEKALLNGDEKNLREELVQVAAVCVRMLERSAES